MRSLQLDDTTVFALEDCAPAPVAAAGSFPDADLTRQPALAERWFPRGAFITRFCVFVVKTASRTIVVDCGLGPDEVAYFPGLHGRLDGEMRRVGIALAQVDTVVFTHLHIDHVGWAKAFSNARFAVATEEWEHWRHHGDAAGRPHHMEAFKANIVPMAQAGRLDCIDAKHEIAPGVRLRPAQGHTPGHHAVFIRTASGSLLIAGDTWHNPAQISVPEWSHRADMNQDAAIATRRGITDWAISQRCIVGAGHFVEDACFGRIVREGNVAVWRAIG